MTIRISSTRRRIQEDAYDQRAIEPGEEGEAAMPHSEVCMHMRVAGKRMKFRFLPNGRSVQLLNPDGTEFSAPISYADAGIFRNPDGTFYYYPELTYESRRRPVKEARTKRWSGYIKDVPKEIRDRLEYLRGELRAERISYEELAELQDLADYIDPEDVELLEPAGVPEFDDVEEARRRPTNRHPVRESFREADIAEKMKAKGYQYAVVFPGGVPEPLYVKTEKQAAELVRSDYADTKGIEILPIDRWVARNRGKGESRKYLSRRMVEGIAGVKILKMALAKDYHGRKEGVILWELDGPSHKKYGTHQFDPDDPSNWYWGHYFDVWAYHDSELAEVDKVQLEQATDDFLARVKKVGAREVPLYAASYAPLVKELEGLKDESRRRSRKRPVPKKMDEETQELQVSADSSQGLFSVSVRGPAGLVEEALRRLRRFSSSIEVWDEDRWATDASMKSFSVNVMAPSPDGAVAVVKNALPGYYFKGVESRKRPVRERRALKESAHTPGPWTLESGRSIVTPSGTFYLAYGSNPRTGEKYFKSPTELDANAHLVAAAPEMLEALKVLADWPRQSTTADGALSGDPATGLANVRRFARAAIAKAEGK